LVFCAHNEPVGKVLWGSESDVFGGHLTLPKHEILGHGAFCEVISFYISPKNLLGDFFYSLNDKGEAARTHPKKRQDYSCSPRPACYATAFISAGSFRRVNSLR